MRSTIGIDIAAPADLVFRLARDVERWPVLLPHYVAAIRHGAPDDNGRLVVAFVARRSLVPVLGLGLSVAWRSLTWSEPAERRLRFTHRGGATAGMDVTWRIDERPGDACRVEIEHDFRPRVPGPRYAQRVRAGDGPVRGHPGAQLHCADRRHFHDRSARAGIVCPFSFRMRSILI